MAHPTDHQTPTVTNCRSVLEALEWGYPLHEVLGGEVGQALSGDPETVAIGVG